MARLRLLPAGAILVVLGGCYSWQLGTSPSDAGDDTSASPSDGSQRHDVGSPGSDGGHPIDATLPIDTGRPADAMPANHPDVGSCPSLFNEAMAALRRAQVCTETDPPECVTDVQDPCGCTAFLAQSANQASQAYRTALAALSAASCGVAASCKTCVPYTGAAGECLESFALDGSFAFACSP